MRYKLQVLEGDRPSREFDLVGDNILLGRDHHCEVSVEGPRVSRRHARLVRQHDGYAIEDLKSRNRTYVNGEAIEGLVPLQEGDQVRMGEVVLAFRAPLPRAMEREDSSANILRTLNLRGGAIPIRKTTAEARLRAVLSINKALGRTLDLDTLLPKVLAGLFDVFDQADRALMLLCEGDRLVPKAVRHRQGQPESIEYSRTIVREAMTKQQAILSEDAASDERFPLTRSIQDFQIRSVMCVPLLSPADDVLGVVQVDTRDPRRKFDDDDMQVLAAVATQASVAVEYAQLHKEMVKQARFQKEIDIARDVQHSFLPKSTPDLEGYSFWAYYLAAGKVGGDFYDFLRLPDGRQAVLLGDVSGKGIPAALMMAKASTVCKVALLNYPDNLADAMHAINNEVCDVSVQAAFITLAICVIDPRTSEITLGNAGHMSPVFRRADGTIDEPADEDVRGYPLGVERGFCYKTHVTRLNPGESVLLFSDGISEAMDCGGELYSVDRIHRHLARMSGAGPAELGKTLVEDVRRHLGDCDQNDDISLVVFRRGHPS